MPYTTNQTERANVEMEEFVRERLQKVRERVAEALSKGGRGSGEVRILVAGKYYSPEQVAALSRA
ncbi:MAG: hypothetical protein M3289_06110, partial [Actinomycetota bacterium]|nr:hypothetical protein [Actinomycetota bacterium]